MAEDRSLYEFQDAVGAADLHEPGALQRAINANTGEPLPATMDWAENDRHGPNFVHKDARKGGRLALPYAEAKLWASEASSRCRYLGALHSHTNESSVNYHRYPSSSISLLQAACTNALSASVKISLR
jgi:hypothetical protein